MQAVLDEVGELGVVFDDLEHLLLAYADNTVLLEVLDDLEQICGTSEAAAVLQQLIQRPERSTKGPETLCTPRPSAQYTEWRIARKRYKVGPNLHDQAEVPASKALVELHKGHVPQVGQRVSVRDTLGNVAELHLAN